MTPLPKPVRTTTAKAGALAVALWLALTASAQEIELPDIGGPGGDALPVAEERRLGDRMMREIRRFLPLVEDPEVTQYIRDLGHRLAAHSEDPAYGFNFFVVDDSNINAFAMPGGHIGLYSGLIVASESESELGGVVAHEIAHVTQRHIARNYAQAQRLNLQAAAAVLAGILIGSQDPQAGSAAIMAGIAAPIQQQLRYSRDYEREADRVGVRTMARAGLDPRGMPRFFERLAEASQYAEQPPEYLSSHPLTQQRLTETQEMANRHRNVEIFESGDHAFIRARLQVAGERTAAEAVTAMRDRLTRAEEPSYRRGARYGLALALARDGRHGEARLLLDRLLDEQGERLLILLARAEVEREAEEWEAALAIYKSASSLYPGNQAVLHRYAETLMAVARHEEARRLLVRHAASDRPALLRLLAEAAHAGGREAEGYIALAKYYHALSEFNSAMAQLNNALRHAGDAPYQRAEAEALRDRWQESYRGQQEPSSGRRLH